MPSTTSPLGLTFGTLTDQISDLMSVPELAQNVNDMIAGTAGLLLPHAAFVYRNSGDGDATVANSTVTSIGFPTELFDTDGYHVSSPNNRLTVPTGLAGYYLIGSSIHWTPSTGGTRRQLFLDKNNSGNLLVNSQQSATPPAGSGPAQSVTTLQLLADGDYIQCNVYQDSGSGNPIQQQDSYIPNLWMVRLPFV